MRVAHTDGIELSFARTVLERLRRLDYASNNLGWGIDSIAVCFCYASALMIVRDDGCRVQHPECRGYDTRLATQQWRVFMQQMTEPEQCIQALMCRFTEPRKRSPCMKLKNEWRALHRKLASNKARLSAPRSG